MQHAIGEHVYTGNTLMLSTTHLSKVLPELHLARLFSMIFFQCESAP